MGYYTSFNGSFSVSPILHPKTKEFLEKLSMTRRMGRKGMLEMYGKEGEFFVDAEGDSGQDNNNPLIIDGNKPPCTQPGLWCQWIPSDNGDCLEWDGGEKFYKYVEWITYIIDKILKPNGYKVNGEVKWQGDEMDDRGLIIIKDNIITERLLE